MFSCHLHRISCRNAKQFSCFFGEDHTLIIKLIGFFCRSAAEFHKLINRHIIRHDHQIDIQFFVSGRKLHLFHGYFCKRFHTSVIGKLLFQFVLPALICICIQNNHAIVNLNILILQNCHIHNGITQSESNQQKSHTAADSDNCHEESFLITEQIAYG